MIQHLVFLLALHTGAIQTGGSPAQGQENKLSCINDYIVTVKCTLGTPGYSDDAKNVSRRLEFQRDDGMKFNCLLTETADYFKCAFRSSDTFTDGERFVITLYSATHSNGTVLEEVYRPVKHVKPLTPCNLTVRWVSDAYVLTWDHGYESIKPPIFLIKYLQYRLSYYRSGRPDKGVENHLLNKSIRIAGDALEPDTEYVARVCSGPAGTHYRGEWSSWSQAVQWRTRKRKAVTPDSSGDFKVSGTAFLCVPLGMMALLCFWRKTRSAMNACSRVPSPAPFFHSLYSSYKGDFQRWLVSQGNPGGPLKVDAQKIDALTEVGPVDNRGLLAPPHHSTHRPAAYVNPRSCSGVSSAQAQRDALLPESFLTGGSSEPKGPSHDEQYCTLPGVRDDLVPCAAFALPSDARSCKRDPHLDAP